VGCGDVTAVLYELAWLPGAPLVDLDEHLAGITDVLIDVEQRADELNRRAAELADEWL
jgi:hypothetical protein